MPTNPSNALKTPKHLRQTPGVGDPHGHAAHVRLVEDAGRNDLGDHGIPYFTGEADRLLRCPGKRKAGNVESRDGKKPLGIGFEDPSIGTGRLDDPAHLGTGIDHGRFLLRASTMSTAPSMEWATGTPFSLNPSMSMAYFSTLGT